MASGGNDRQSRNAGACQCQRNYDHDAGISSIFSNFQASLNAELEKREEIKEEVKQLESTVRTLMTILQKIHQPAGIQKVNTLLDQVSSLMSENVRLQQASLSSKVPAEDFYRYHDQWRNVTQRLVYVAVLVEFLRSNELLSRDETASTLYMNVDRSPGSMYLDLEDYLHGVLLVANELSRLAVNSVTSGEYHMPSQISRFMNDLDSGFRLLNLKNDSLRKRFDSLKYDMKKVEEVVYDVTIRGLSGRHADCTLQDPAT